MPMPSFLSSIADKAQSAIQASPLAGHLPSSLGPRPASPDDASQPPANQAAAQGGHKSHTLEAISHQFRSLQQQYSSTTPVQKIITASKGVALDFDCVARDTKAQSKELYTWGQNEPEDLKDVTDRLAYLNFVHGSLASTLAQRLNTARGPFKALRDAESALQPRRNIRAGLQAQISKVENDPKKAADLREQLRKAELEDAQAEKEIELLKRKAVRESEQLKWEAIREYAEKLVLLSQASLPITAALPTLPPDQQHPYLGGTATAAARASLQRALDNYKTGHINLPPPGADLSRSDTRSFGESHATELSNITPYTPAHHAQTPPIQSTSAPPFPAAPQESKLSPPIDPSALNQAPAPIPAVSTPVAPAVADTTSPAENTAPVMTPTVAETGIPVDGPPGPSKGSLHDLKHASSQSGALQSPPAFPSEASVPTSQHESAEEEKRRLAAAYSHAQAAPSTTAGSPPPEASKPESAEEEKKRLEREERERILRGEQARKDTNPDEDLPPYQEPTLQ
ncbi:hypothetical protein CC1G_06757 [Coprinopsis cinerea okayama7|uniref:Sphingolipid long chain base-responsive protein LSP1 n=1 Tax=Coprinopsis cinerea (strain Okayama-7 / 130 / ATCC MYA-4618 / FGSC 9003) TaxID=240176 RepID=A8N1J1_COPC7|nr:hypothetical protein CC1G_06757 [Coprinopsis cinerea okayama7\|eukprot:XP_001828771.1 hypothetical protein CC1G_06757 [Coprinopsis cinerea okayama7\